MKVVLLVCCVLTSTAFAKPAAERTKDGQNRFTIPHNWFKAYFLCGYVPDTLMPIF